MHFEPFSLVAIVSAILAFGFLAYLIESTERHYAKRFDALRARALEQACENATRAALHR